MGRQRDAGVPESGYISKQQFNNTGSIAKSDFAVVADLDNTRKIAFDPSAQATGTTVTFASGASSGNITITLPATSGTIATSASSFANPMTTGGDIIYGGASGVATRLANGTSGQVLTSAGTTLAPTWTTISAATPTLNNLGTTAINASLFVDTDGTYDIGSTTAAVRRIFANEIRNAGNKTILDVSNAVLSTPSGDAAIDLNSHFLKNSGTTYFSWVSGSNTSLVNHVFRASTTSAGTAPISIQAGTLMTTPETGAIEFDGVHLYITIAGVRKTITVT